MKNNGLKQSHLILAGIILISLLIISIILFFIIKPMLKSSPKYNGILEKITFIPYYNSKENNQNISTETPQENIPDRRTTLEKLEEFDQYVTMKLEKSDQNNVIEELQEYRLIEFARNNEHTLANILKIFPIDFNKGKVSQQIKELALKNHPDKGGSEEKMALLNKLNEKLKIIYDRAIGHNSLFLEYNLDDITADKVGDIFFDYIRKYNLDLNPLYGVQERAWKEYMEIYELQSKKEDEVRDDYRELIGNKFTKYDLRKEQKDDWKNSEHKKYWDKYIQISELTAKNKIIRKRLKIIFSFGDEEGCSLVSLAYKKTRSASQLHEAYLPIMEKLSQWLGMARDDNYFNLEVINNYREKFQKSYEHIVNIGEKDEAYWTQVLLNFETGEIENEQKLINNPEGYYAKLAVANIENNHFGINNSCIPAYKYFLYNWEKCKKDGTLDETIINFWRNNFESYKNIFTTDKRLKELKIELKEAKQKTDMAKQEAKKATQKADAATQKADAVTQALFRTFKKIYLGKTDQEIMIMVEEELNSIANENKNETSSLETTPSTSTNLERVDDCVTSKDLEGGIIV